MGRLQGHLVPHTGGKGSFFLLLGTHINTLLFYTKKVSIACVFLFYEGMEWALEATGIFLLL